METPIQTLSHNAKSFRFAGAFLAPDVLLEAAQVYQFCRIADDLADAPEKYPDLSLDELRSRLFAGAVVAGGEFSKSQADWAWLEEFLRLVQKRKMSLSAIEQLLLGIASDQGSVRVANTAALLLYCYRVAGCVGLLMCPVIGVRDPRALPFAVDLGIAMQLTNIARDVQSDLEELDRVYIPTTWLAGRAKPGMKEVDLKAWAPLVTRLLDLADTYYESGERGLRYIPWRARFAILIASRIYRAIGQKLRMKGSDPSRGRVALSRIEKLLWAIPSSLLFLRPGTLGWSDHPRHDRRLHERLPPLDGIDVG